MQKEDTTISSNIFDKEPDIKDQFNPERPLHQSDFFINDFLEKSKEYFEIESEDN